MTVGLFFGSFNPIHSGHLIIAHTIKELLELHEVWFVVSPQNPLKNAKNLLNEQDRLDMVRAAIHDDSAFRACDIEFAMPRPSYTVDTLAYLRERYPKREFKLIMGEDNLRSFEKWKNHEEILNNHKVIVYPRYRRNGLMESIERRRELLKKGIDVAETPNLDISATYIRNLLRMNKSVKYLVPDPVWELINSRRYYQD